MKWINSTGGPSIIIATAKVKKWSGIGTIEAALKNEFEETEDFMDPNQCHYGQACEIINEIGLVKIQGSTTEVIIIGDEPLQMTVLGNAEKTGIIIVKWSFGENVETVESFLDFNELEVLPNWQALMTAQLHSDEHILLDAAASGFDLEKDEIIKFELKKGTYAISSLTFSPNEKTEMYLYQFKRK
ncbi:MAG: hypothetical protein GQ574_14135 [Crocinitomix sp.]|nr:hypothetical protein [Crocinitomix sp.]